MRKLAIFLPFLFMLAACEDDRSIAMVEPVVNNAPAPKEGARLQDFGERYAAAWSSQHPDSVAAFFAIDGSLSVNDGEPAIGRQAIAKVAKGFMDAFPDLVVTMDRLVTRTDGVEFHWTLTGTNTGPGGTGYRVRISGSEDWLLNQEGLVQRSIGRFDAQDYDHQVRGTRP